MPTDRHDTPTAANETVETRRNPWLDPRRFRFWAVALVLVYTLAGFFLAPLLVEKLAVDGVRDTIGRELTIGKVRVNPFVLSAEVEDLALREPDGATLFAFDRFRANFQLSSLFRWAWTFREIRVDAPYFLYERFAPGDDRLARLLADMERLDAGPDSAAGESAGLPRLLIHDLQVNAGRGAFRDDVPQVPVALDAGPVTVEIHELNTLPDRSGRQSVEVLFADGAAIGWEGSLALAPLVSEGRLTLQNFPLDPALSYLEGVVDLQSFTARLSMRTAYRLDERADGAIAFALTELETDLEDLRVTGFEPAERILEIGAVRTRGGRLDYAEQSLDVGGIDVQGLVADLQLDESGEPRLLGLLKPQSGDAPAAGADDSEPPWRIAADTLEIEQARIALEDRGVEPAAALTVAGLDLRLSAIDNRDGTAMPLAVTAALEGGGSIGFEGQITALPAVTANGRVAVSGLPLALVQPYVAGILAVAIDDGALGAEFELALDDSGAARVEGDAHVEDLQVLDTVENQPLLAWKRLAVDRFLADTDEARVNVSRVELDQPFGRVQVRADRSTNLSGLVLDDPAADAGDASGAGDPPEATPAWNVDIAVVDFVDGGMDFSDLSLPLPFAVRIAELGGSVSGIASDSSEAAGIRLEGKVGDYGLARIGGEIRLFDPLADTDITMEFRNLLMSELSPYSIEFAGRRIDEGKLNLDLEYLVENSQLAGANQIVVSDLVLGEKVDSPNAVSLPLDLAVALLRDSNGVIDIDLPVEGDVGDPEFRIGGVIWKAFTTLLTKIVTAPFALLGNLVGSDAEDFGQFEFLAGRADLTPPELEKVAQLTEALQQRPQLALEISGVYDEAIDTPMLQYFKLKDAVWQRLGRGPAEHDRGETNELLSGEFVEVLEELFRERFPDTGLDTIRAAHSAPPEADPEGEPQLDTLAYGADLRDRLLASETVETEDLLTLARARAEAVRAAFLAGGALTDERLLAVEPVAVESGDGEWVLMELGVDIR